MTNLRASFNEVFSVIAVFSLARLKAGRASLLCEQNKKWARYPSWTPGP
jgi:hypothetical protein